MNGSIRDEKYHANRQTVLLVRTERLFGGPYRKKSDRYGLTVYLCHNSCHIFGKNAVHNNRAQDVRLKRLGQKAWMERQGKSAEYFINEFGRNYLVK